MQDYIRSKSFRESLIPLKDKENKSFHAYYCHLHPTYREYSYPELVSSIKGSLFIRFVIILTKCRFKIDLG